MANERENASYATWIAGLANVLRLTPAEMAPTFGVDESTLKSFVSGEQVPEAASSSIKRVWNQMSEHYYELLSPTEKAELAKVVQGGR